MKNRVHGGSDMATVHSFTENKPLTLVQDHFYVKMLFSKLKRELCHFYAVLNSQKPY